MDLSKYTSFFHDGSLLDILHTGNTIVFSMSSAEIDRDDLQEDIILSKDNRIQGKLHVEEIKGIKIDSKWVTDKIHMIHDDAGIHHLKVNRNNIELDIIWVDYPPKPRINEFSIIEIAAEKIWWETIPNLESYS